MMRASFPHSVRMERIVKALCLSGFILAFFDLISALTLVKYDSAADFWINFSWISCAACIACLLFGIWLLRGKGERGNVLPACAFGWVGLVGYIWLIPLSGAVEKESRRYYSLPSVCVVLLSFFATLFLLAAIGVLLRKRIGNKVDIVICACVIIGVIFCMIAVAEYQQIKGFESILVLIWNFRFLLLFVSSVSILHLSGLHLSGRFVKPEREFGEKVTVEHPAETLEILREALKNGMIDEEEDRENRARILSDL